MEELEHSEAHNERDEAYIIAVADASVEKYAMVVEAVNLFAAVSAPMAHLRSPDRALGTWSSQVRNVGFAARLEKGDAKPNAQAPGDDRKVHKCREGKLCYSHACCNSVQPYCSQERCHSKRLPFRTPRPKDYLLVVQLLYTPLKRMPANWDFGLHRSPPCASASGHEHTVVRMTHQNEPPGLALPTAASEAAAVCALKKMGRN